MTYTEQAIKIAIENGYKFTIRMNMASARHKSNQSVIVLDPAFWRALGLGLGWGDENGIDSRTFWNGTVDYPEVSDEGIGYREISRYKMHCFVDHLHSDKDTESYFKNLLEK